jgi:hypothetical protein
MELEGLVEDVVRVIIVLGEGLWGDKVHEEPREATSSLGLQEMHPTAEVWDHSFTEAERSKGGTKSGATNLSPEERDERGLVKPGQEDLSTSELRRKASAKGAKKAGAMSAARGQARRKEALEQEIKALDLLQSLKQEEQVFAQIKENLRLCRMVQDENRQQQQQLLLLQQKVSAFLNTA